MLSALTILITAVGVFIIGVIFLRRGIWPRRVGDTPYCRRCNYNLTGIESNRCPECGSDITSATIVHGMRRKRPGLIVAGAACLLPLLIVAGLSIAKVDWYRYKPTGWVIADLNINKPGDWRRAWSELDRRTQAGRLSAKQESQLIDALLVEQGKLPTNPNVWQFFGPQKAVIDYLATAYLAGNMSESQAERFFAQIVQLELDVRKRIVEGSNISYEVSARSRCGLSPWWIAIEDVRPELPNGQSVAFGGGGASFNGYGGMGGTAIIEGGIINSLSPGTHSLVVNLTVATYTGQHLSAIASTLRHRRDVRLEAQFEILAAESPDCIKMIDDPLMRETLVNCFKPKSFRFADSPIRGIRGEITVKPPPINIAFDVIVRARGSEIRIGKIVCAKGAGNQPWRESYYWADNGPAINSVDLILRSNEELVRRTIDMYEAWKGELVYEDVPVSSNSAP